MGYPTVVFNTSTGSDTAASGAGPATALTGTAASFSGSVFTLDGSPDLSGVATDSTHVIYVVTSTGRRFFEITAKDNTAKTVTVANAPAGTSTGLTWALGGKRATWNDTDSRLLFSTDRKAGWTLRTETDQTITSTTLDVNTGFADLSGMVIEGDDPATLRVINQTANTPVINETASILVRNLKFTNSNGTKSSAVGAGCNGVVGYFFFNCVFGDATNQLVCATGSYGQFTFESCVIQYCTGGQGSQSVNSVVRMTNCQYIHNGGPWYCTYYGGTFINCLFAGNTGDGLVTQQGYGPYCLNCTFADNTGDGLDLDGGSSQPLMVAGIVNCDFSANGGYGVRGASASQIVQVNAGNNYGSGAGANTSGGRLNTPAGLADTALDPQYTNAAGGDWSIGTNLKANALVSRYPHATTVSYQDTGGVQRQEPSASSGPAATLRTITNIGTY